MRFGGKDEGTNLGEAVCVYETEKAILVRLEDVGTEIWVPKSCVHDDSEVYEENGEGELVVAAWWAEKEGLG